MPIINQITNASDRRVTILQEGEELHVISPFEQSNGNLNLDIPTSNGIMEIALGGENLNVYRLEIYETNGEIWLEYGSPALSIKMEQIGCNPGSHYNLLVINRPKTNSEGLTTNSIWVIGDVDTGGGQ